MGTRQLFYRSRLAFCPPKLYTFLFISFFLSRFDRFIKLESVFICDSSLFLQKRCAYIETIEFYTVSCPKYNERIQFIPLHGSIFLMHQFVAKREHRRSILFTRYFLLDFC